MVTDIFQHTNLLELPSKGSMTEGSSVNLTVCKPAGMAWLTRYSQFEFDDRQMYFLSLPLSSVNCLETTLLVKLAIDSLVFVQH